MFAYKAVVLTENKLQEFWWNLTDDPNKPDTFIREYFTGWFSDMSTTMQGFNLRKIVMYPRLYLDPGYRALFKGMDLGGDDAGFLSMTHGFGVFFLCIALAVRLKVTCR